MSYFKIQGGAKLKGEVTPSGNKNEALPALAASVLCDDTIILKRIPRIGDVITFCEILEKLGARIGWIGEDAIEINCSGVHSYAPDPLLCAKMRASILLLGPLLSRFAKVEQPLPGGDVIGARRIDTHLEGMIQLGAELKFEKNITGSAKKIRGAEIFMDEPSVTGTENLLLLAVKAEGRTVLHNAASEPHVTGLCNMLNAMGAKISGMDSNKLIIEGVESLHGTNHTVGADFMEVGSFICLGALSKNHITINDVNAEDFRFILKSFSKIGIEVLHKGNSFVVDGSNVPKIKTDISGRVATIYSSPWPAFPTDLMSVAIVAATQAEGTLVFFEKMFEGRMFFTDKLMMMGATIIPCDPHRIVVNGPSVLRGSHMSSPDVRAGMALLMAALIAKGESEIHNIYQIERGYYQIEKKLQELGAKIKKFD